MSMFEAPVIGNLTLFHSVWILAFIGFLTSLFYTFKEGTKSKKLNWLLPITAVLGVMALIVR